MNKFLEMSDEELQNMETPEGVPATASENKEEEIEEISEEVEEVTEEKEVTEEAENDSKGEENSPEDDESEEPEEVSKENAEDSPDNAGKSKDKPSDKKEDDPSVSGSPDKGKEKETDIVPAEIDYKAEYERLLSPIKANGKEIKLDSIDEVITMVQLGANYTKKMQAIRPGLKLIKMLENNNLLDEGKLSHLIDISKGDKNAISKFLKDASIDPMDIDPDTGVGYRPGNHKISDADMNWETALSDAQITEAGQQVIVDIHKDYDDQSKAALYKEPDHLRILISHKELGIYDQIVREVEKHRSLGTPGIAGEPYLKAYNLIGNDLKEKGLLQFKVGKQNAPAKEPEKEAPVILGKPAPRKKPANGDRAKAASPVTQRKGKAPVSYADLSKMSDDEFLKYAEDKV